MRLCRPINRVVRLALVASAFFAGVPPVTARADDILVFAAASLKTALDEVVASFETDSGHKVIRSYAGSSTLARQIALGAPAQVFISANPGWMDYLAGQNLIDDATRFDALSNRLVLIAPKALAAPVDLSDAASLPAALSDGVLAMALVDAVPAGIYGKAALEHFGLWDRVATQVAQTDNVRAALALVALGEARFGITYETDADAEPAVSIVASFPAESHPPIRYPVAALKGRATKASDDFLTFLKTPSARAVFQRHGFGVIGDGP